MAIIAEREPQPAPGRTDLGGDAPGSTVPTLPATTALLTLAAEPATAVLATVARDPATAVLSAVAAESVILPWVPRDVIMATLLRSSRS